VRRPILSPYRLGGRRADNDTPRGPKKPGADSMKRLIFFAYGALSYAIFFATFLYTGAFLMNLEVPKTIDSGEPGSIATAVAVNLGLLALFAIQHSGMARPAFKRAWTRIIPMPIERATYVLLSSIVLIIVMAFWQPMAGTLWHFTSDAGRAVGFGVFGLGIATVLYSTMLIDHFELFGLRQVIDQWMRRPARDGDFVTPSLYRFVRHPLYVGWFVTLWATPSMSMSHGLFAAVSTAYILIAVQLEERDLIAAFGSRYEMYCATTPMFIPRGRKANSGLAGSPTA
jgi:protein-S-isoprenylcysteine O-methyltransferase Ste14